MDFLLAVLEKSSKNIVRKDRANQDENLGKSSEEILILVICTLSKYDYNTYDYSSLLISVSKKKNKTDLLSCQFLYFLLNNVGPLI